MSEPSESSWERAYEESIEREEMASKPILTDSFVAFSDRLRALIFVSALRGAAIGLVAQLLGVGRSGTEVTYWVGCVVVGIFGGLVWQWRVRRRGREWDDWPPRD